MTMKICQLQINNRVKQSTDAVQKLFNTMESYKTQKTDLNVLMPEMKTFELGLFNGTKKCCNTKFITHGEFADVKSCVCNLAPKMKFVAVIGNGYGFTINVKLKDVRRSHVAVD